jgi:hypothetical protein
MKAASAGVTYLAIEEPELFQHPRKLEGSPPFCEKLPLAAMPRCRSSMRLILRRWIAEPTLCFAEPGG